MSIPRYRLYLSSMERNDAGDWVRYADLADVERVVECPLRQAAQALLDRLTYVHAHPAYQSVWTLHMVHGGQYAGPTYTDAMNALYSALEMGCVSNERSPQNGSPMNLTIWTGIREYIAAEIALADARRNLHAASGAEDIATLAAIVRRLEEQSTRMETSVREAL